MSDAPRASEAVHMPGGWRFDKSLNLGHLLTVLSILIPVFIWGTTVESRISVVERMQIEQASQQERGMADIKDRMDRDSRTTEASFRDIKDWLKAIREDIARKVDRNFGPIAP